MTTPSGIPAEPTSLWQQVVDLRAELRVAREARDDPSRRDAVLMEVNHLRNEVHNLTVQLEESGRDLVRWKEEAARLLREVVALR
jgi:hypothetical protein